MTIQNWIPTLTANMAAITGIQQAHDYTTLPGNIQVFPTILVMPVSGTQTGGSSAPGIAIHQVQVTLYLAAQILPEALSVAVPFIALVRNKIYSAVTLSSKVTYCLPTSEGPFYEGPGIIKYGDKDLCGVVFHLTVKEIESLTVTA
jgi:hypothetical protein